MDLYKDASVKDAIVEEKNLSRHTWRPHPEIPACKAAIQYLCNVKDEKVNEARNVVTKSMKWQGKLQGEEARMVMQVVASRSDKILDKAGLLPIEDIRDRAAPGTPGAPGGALGGAPQTPRTNTLGGGWCKGGKTAEEKATEKADREAANAHAREQAREQRRQDKLKPAPRAQQWCEKVQTYIGQCGDIMAQCKDASTALPPSFAAQYNVTFTSGINTLEDSRKKLTD
jgi:hypothetical protein